MWAHLIHMKNHTSYDEPPNKRFWKPKLSGTGTTGVTTSGATGATNSEATGPTTSRSSDVAIFRSVSASPGKQVNLRGKYIETSSITRAFDNGGLTQEQYTEMKEGIMNEIKKFD